METNNFNQQAPVQQAPIANDGPTSVYVANKKPADGIFGKQHIFMAVAILLGSGIIPAILSAIFGGIIELMENSVGYYDNSYASTANLISSIHTLLSVILTVVIYAVFGYLAYKKLAKAACFIGVSFVAVKLSGLITGLINVFLSLIGVIVNAIDYSAYYDYLAVQNVLQVLVSIFGVILSIAAGVFLLMIVEKGKLNIKKKNKNAPAQQAPVQN